MNEQETAQVANRIDAASAERIANLRMGLLEACSALLHGPGGVAASSLAKRLRDLAGVP
jgi:hypothetical protein